QPVLARQVTRLGQDLNDIPIAQRVPQRHDSTVYLRAYASLPDIGVDRIGEVDGCGVAWQYDHFSARSEGVHLLRVQVHFQRGHELAGILDILLPLDQVPQPGNALIVVRRPLFPFFVIPVRGDALFRNAMHLFGADLHLEMPAFRAHNGCVQRLIQIGAGNSDEILDPARYWPPFIVDHAQCPIAVPDRIGDDADRHEIVHLLDGYLLALHLL